MKNLKRIMVGIDIFAKSDNVLKRALILAKENKAELFVVQAIQTPWFSVPDYFSSKEIIVDIKGIKKKIEKKIKKLNLNIEVSCFILVKEGNADDIILYESKLLKADMIVIGAHTKAKKRKSFLGSTAQKVVHQSHLPVLIVKNRVEDPYKNILAPTDFGMQSKQSILFAKSICPSAKIKVVHVYEAFYTTGIYTAGSYTLESLDIKEYNEATKASAENNLKEFMKEVSVKKGKVIDGEFNSKEVLLQYIKKNSYDLVVVSSRGAAGFNILLGSMASFILRETPTDVLVYMPID
jgi:nucleotide-binding universal stress UspA family protein